MIEIQVYDKDFIAQMKKAREAALDLSVPFRLIQQSWFKGNRAIFDVKQGPGKYPDLKKSTKKQKLRQFGSIYPVLRATGFLERTMIKPGDQANFIGKSYMTVGTSVPYAHFLQDGTKKMVARPPVLLGPEQVAPKEINTRKQKWIEMITEFITESLGE